MKDWTEEIIEKQLKSYGCELWPGETFYLTDPKEMEKAVAWAKELIQAIEH